MNNLPSKQPYNFILYALFLNANLSNKQANLQLKLRSNVSLKDLDTPPWIKSGKSSRTWFCNQICNESHSILMIVTDSKQLDYVIIVWVYSKVNDRFSTQNWISFFIIILFSAQQHILTWQTPNHYKTPSTPHKQKHTDHKTNQNNTTKVLSLSLFGTRRTELRAEEIKSEWANRPKCV